MGTADQDAINLKQLKDAGQDGRVRRGAQRIRGLRRQDEEDSVTLEGANGTQIHKVTGGTADKDAINLRQLKDAGLKTDTRRGDERIRRDGDKTKKDSVTLEGSNGTQIHNVKPGTADQDAMNLKQLKDAGLKTTEASGNLTNPFARRQRDEGTKSRSAA